MSSKSPVNRFVICLKPSIFWENCIFFFPFFFNIFFYFIKLAFLGCPPNFTIDLHVQPTGVHTSPSSIVAMKCWTSNPQFAFLLILRRFEVVFNVWSENAALFEILNDGNLFKSTNTLLWLLKIGSIFYPSMIPRAMSSLNKF